MMDTTAKRHMGIGVTGDIKGVRVRELAGVTIRRREDQQDSLSLADRLPMELDIRCRDAWRALDRSIVAQHFLRGTRDVRRVPLELYPVVRVAEEGQDAVPDEVDGCLMAGNEQEESIPQHFVPRQAAFLLPCGQHGEEVILRAGELLLH